MPVMMVFERFFPPASVNAPHSFHRGVGSVGSAGRPAPNQQHKHNKQPKTDMNLLLIGGWSGKKKPVPTQHGPVGTATAIIPTVGTSLQWLRDSRRYLGFVGPYSKNKNYAIPHHSELMSLILIIVLFTTSITLDVSLIWTFLPCKKHYVKVDGEDSGKKAY